MKTIRLLKNLTVLILAATVASYVGQAIGVAGGSNLSLSISFGALVMYFYEAVLRIGDRRGRRQS